MPLWLVACALAAFLATLAGFELQAWIWPRPPAAELPFAAATQYTPQKAEDAAETMREIPTPAGAREVYVLTKPDVWGGRFQGFYETDMPAAEVLAFYRQTMPSHGWRLDQAFSAALSQAEGGRNLAFSRGRQRMLVTIFETEEGEGCDFRVSILSRPPTAGLANTPTAAGAFRAGAPPENKAEWNEQ